MEEIKLKTFSGDPSILEDWMETLQKKWIIYGLTDEKLVLLAFDKAIQKEGLVNQRRLQDRNHCQTSRTMETPEEPSRKSKKQSDLGKTDK